MGLDKLGKKRKVTRVLHLIEIYYQRYKEKIKPLYDERLKEETTRLSQTGGKSLSNGDRLVVLRSLLGELYEAEDETVRAEIAGEQLKQREQKSLEHAEEDSEPESEEGVEAGPTPDERQKYVALSLFMLILLTAAKY